MAGLVPGESAMRNALLVLLALALPAPLRAAEAEENLWDAARRGAVKEVEALLGKGVAVNARTRYGEALWFAAYKGKREVVRALLARKADPNLADTVWGLTPLELAAYGESPGMVQALLRAGARGADGVFLQLAALGKLEVAQAILAVYPVSAEALDAALVVSRSPGTVALLKKAGARTPTPASAAQREAWKAYAGTYESPNGLAVRVALQEGLLLVRYSQGVHVLKPDGESFRALGYEGVRWTFEVKGGKVWRLRMGLGKTESRFEPAPASKAPEPRPGPIKEEEVAIARPRNWPSFRGPGASGVADGQLPPTVWDVKKPHANQWKTPIPGLAHSCPVVWGDRVFVTTAVSSDPKTEFKPGLYGAGTASKDVSKHSWRVYCLDRRTGKVLWERTACAGVPKVKRHIKASHANATPATDGKRLVVSFDSEGLYCYDLAGKRLWKQDLGILDAGAFNDPETQWGAGSSPVLYKGLVLVQCDRQKDSYLAAFHLDTGKRAWRTPRDEPPSWGTPTVYEGPKRPELITNGTNHIRGYDPLTGKELWRLARNSHITVPTPVVGCGLIFVTSGYRPVQPIYAIWPGATGDISLKEGRDSSASVAWSKVRGGPYMPTPIVYGDYLYTCSNNGTVACYEARTGKQVYRRRLGGSDAYTASPVAADGRLYFTSEEGRLRVVKAGPSFQLLAVNDMGESCMATPAISAGMLFVRTRHHLHGIGRPPAKAGR
jgi:outer membrane protein assembly factor BamB